MVALLPLKKGGLVLSRSRRGKWGKEEGEHQVVLTTYYGHAESTSDNGAVTVR
jgi:hypothetical protein